MFRDMITLGFAASLTLATITQAEPQSKLPRPKPEAEKTRYEKTVEAVNEEIFSTQGQKRAEDYGMTVMSTAWEDNGRTKGSVWGPLISDYSIYVHIKNEGKFKRAIQVPLLRFPNFEDKTADQPPSKFFIKVGNEKNNRKPELISLADYLANVNKYLTKPGKVGSLLSPRDTDFVVSAQASFIPLPQGENASADFTPALYQYQSNDIPVDEKDRGEKAKMKKNPAVLVILATREGTSATIVDNKRDMLEGQTTHGQPLFYNQAGLRAPYQAKRKSDFVAGGGNPAEVGVGAAGETGLGMVLMIQVPLKHKEQRRFFGGGIGLESFSATAATRGAGREEAVIGHGEPVGPFTELDGLKLERDERFPIRVTVQFYQAVATGNLDNDDYEAMQKQINAIYSKADAVGSLVLDGKTGRVTEHQGPAWQPPVWWGPWWRVYAQENKISEKEGIKKLEKVYGNGWKYLTTSEEQLKATVIEARIKLKELPESARPKNAEDLEVEKAKQKKD